MNHPDDEDQGAVPGLSRLDLGREPSRDLWAGIEPKLAPRRATAFRPYAAAACLVAGLGAMIGIVVLQSPPARHVAFAPAASVVASSAPATTAQTAASASATSEARHAARIAGGDPTRTLVKANLKIVADAEKEIRRALDADPNSAYLQNLLASAREQRRALRERMAQT